MHFIKPFLAPKARAQRQRSDFGFNFGNFGDFGNPAEAVPLHSLRSSAFQRFWSFKFGEFLAISPDPRSSAFIRGKKVPSPRLRGEKLPSYLFFSPLQGH
jgi:hypothetical protein